MEEQIHNLTVFVPFMVMSHYVAIHEYRGGEGVLVCLLRA